MEKELKFSRLVYEVVRDSIVMSGNSGLSYDAFIRSDDYYSADSDFALQCRKAIPAVNLALARLAEYRKLSLLVSELKNDSKDPAHTFTASLDADKDGKEIHVGEIVNAFVPDDKGGWENYPFRVSGGKVAVTKPCSAEFLSIEYYPDLPRFGEEDIRASKVQEDGSVSYEDSNVDLRDYGVTTQSFEVLKLFAESEIIAELDQQRALNLRSIAENYMGDLSETKPRFGQRRISRRYW